MLVPHRSLRRSHEVRFSRRRALGLSGGAGLAAFLAACGGGTQDETGGAVKEATREAGVIAGSQGAEEAPKQGGNLSVAWPLTPPMDPVANSTYTAQRLASFVYPRLLKFKTDSDPKTAQNYEIVPEMAAAMPEVLDGGLRYSFKLRPDVKSHAKAPLNGRLYTSEDVKASFERFINEPRNPNRASSGTPASRRWRRRTRPRSSSSSASPSRRSSARSPRRSTSG